MADDLLNPDSLLLPQSSIKPINGHDATSAHICPDQHLNCSEETGDEDSMSQSTHHHAASDRQPKTSGLATSPQSTLWSPFGSNQWGQNWPSREPSPENRRRDMTAPAGGAAQPPNSTNQAQTDYQLRAIHFYKLKQEEVYRKQVQGNNRNVSKKSGEARPSETAATGGAGMRAVFLGGGNGCCGTGVFLPRGDRSNPSESRKKLGCSSVLIPAKVVHALTLHFHHVNNTIAISDKNEKSHSEMGLPQEWTY